MFPARGDARSPALLPPLQGADEYAIVVDMETLLRSFSKPSGCSAIWLARLHGVQKVAGSNPVTPTK